MVGEILAIGRSFIPFLEVLMGVLSHVFVAMQARNIQDAGTPDSLVLIINDDGIDKLHSTLRSTPETGGSNLFGLNVGDLDIRSERLTNSSIRLAIRGDSDLWAPRHVLLWGQEAGGPVVPLAAEWLIETRISTDADEGPVSFPVRRIGFPIRNPLVGLPATDTRVRQLLLIMSTGRGQAADTDDAVELEILFAGAGVRRWRQSFRPPPRRQAFFILPPTLQFLEPFPRWNNLEAATLRIKGGDSWRPTTFFLFGFDNLFSDSGGPSFPPPTAIMPLVHIPRWDLAR